MKSFDRLNTILSAHFKRKEVYSTLIFRAFDDES